MNSSSTYLSSHQAAENPSATCRLTGDDSIAHKESALYLKARNLSSIHDGMPNLCRIPDGCGLVYIKMLRLSSFFCQIFEPSQKRFENIAIFIPVFFRSCLPSNRQDTVPPKGRAGPCPPRPPKGETSAEGGDTRLSCRFSATHAKKEQALGKGAPTHARGAPLPPKAVMCCVPAGPSAPRPSHDRCPSPPAKARKAPCLRGRHPA